jgi:phytoene dehydrogenase-like protein
VVTAYARYPAKRAVIADVGAPQLYGELLPAHVIPERTKRDLQRFQYDNPTVKVDWTLDGQIPWKAPATREAGTVHIAASVDALTRYAAQLSCGELPAIPYLVMGQYAAADPTRAAAGKETAWAYTHVPERVRADAARKLTGSWDERETAAFTDRIEAQVEAYAPGFRALIRGRHVFTPAMLQAADRNLVGGALGGGTAQLHQQLIFRPLPGIAGAETPVRRLFLASASAHPGGGVHGGPGANAANAALAAASRWRPALAVRVSRGLAR